MFSVALLLLLAAGCVKCEQLTQPASVTVQPGQRLTITCQVSYSVSSYTAWIRQPAGKGLEWIGMAAAGYTTYYKDSLKNKFSISSDSSSNTVTLNGQNVQPEDTAVYYCATSSSGSYYAFDYWGKGTMVTVTSATPKSPTVFPLMQCGSGTGNTVTLGCFATDFTPSSLTYAWTKNGAALTNSIQYPPVQTGNFYTGISQIQVPKQDWDQKQSFQCAVTHAGGNPPAVTFQNIVPEVYYKQPTLSVLASSDEENQASFSCFAKDFSPKSYKFKWLKNDADITNKIDEIVTPSKERQLENGTKVYSAASFLLVESSEWTRDTTFTCLFEGKGENNLPVFLNSSVTHNKEVSIQPGGECPEADVEITIIGPTMEDMFLNRKGKLECRAQENKPSITEMKFENEDGNDLLGTGMTEVKGYKKTYSISIDISYDEWSQGIKRTCVVTHSENFDPLKKVYERSFGGKLQRPSVFMMPPVEHTRKEMVTLTCFVKDFSPKEVYVSWLVDDDAADSDKTVQTTNPIENSGSYSAYGQLTVSLEQWKQNDKVYSCVVYHESVANTTRAIVRSIGYRTLGNTNLVNLNMNVPDTSRCQ